MKLINKEIPTFVLVISLIIVTISFLFTLIFGAILIWGMITKEVDAVFFVPWFLIALFFLTVGIVLRRIRNK